MKSKIQKLERGQSLVLVALSLLAFIAILALVLDGGYSYYMRRNAQNAADSGALAGARVYCETNDMAQGKLTAKYYVNDNEALVYPNDSVDDVQIVDNRVTVDTQITFNTFFGRVLGRDQVTAVAHAVAGCYSPTLAEGVLPIIWFCKPSLTGELGEDETCIERFITWGTRTTPGTLQYYLANPTQPDGTVWPDLYIVMDDLSYNVDFPCIEDGYEGAYMICDFDGDGEKDHFAGSGRSWTDLDGKSAQNPPELDCPPKQDETTELRTWIVDGFPCELDTHTWTPETTGDRDTVFQAVIDRIRPSGKGPLVLLPVYDDFCLYDTPNPSGPVDCDGENGIDVENKWHVGVDQIRYTNPGYFHIVHFAPFYITCVRRPGQSYSSEDGNVSTCPGYEAFKAANQPLHVIPEIQSVATIEGYFLNGYVPGLKGRGDDDFLTNVFTVYLDE